MRFDSTLRHSAFSSHSRGSCAAASNVRPRHCAAHPTRAYALLLSSGRMFGSPLVSRASAMSERPDHARGWERARSSFSTAALLVQAVEVHPGQQSATSKEPKFTTSESPASARLSRSGVIYAIGSASVARGLTQLLITVDRRLLRESYTLTLRRHAGGWPRTKPTSRLKVRPQ